MACPESRTESRHPTAIGVNGRTDVELLQQATYAGWDFAEVWQIMENESTPRLRASPQ